MAKVGRALRWALFLLLGLGWVIGELLRYLLIGPREAPPRERETIPRSAVAAAVESLRLSA